MSPASPRTVVAVAQFPPPVHGMSVAVAALTALLAASGCDVVRVDVAAPALERSIGYHLRRSLRVARAIVVLIWSRRRANRCYLGCDTGLGMLYTLMLLAAARALRYRVWLHHHSTAYLRECTWLFASVARIGGATTTHLVACGAMADALHQSYGQRYRTAILPLDFVVEPGDAVGGAPDAVDRTPAIVLGHLSNLTIDKGLPAVLDTLEAVLAVGVDARLVLAGPVWTARDREYLAERLRALPHGVAEHIGPVYGEDKWAFFAGLDVFLFPSRYGHESFGIVTAEALASGVPVVAYRAGCLTPEHVGHGGVVLATTEEFVDAATRFVVSLTDPDARAAAKRAAAAQWSINLRAADESAKGLVATIVECR